MLCAWCSIEITGPRYLNTGYGPHHTQCWIERTTP